MCIFRCVIEYIHTKSYLQYTLARDINYILHESLCLRSHLNLRDTMQCLIPCSWAWYLPFPRRPWSCPRFPCTVAVHEPAPALGGAAHVCCSSPLHHSAMTHCILARLASIDSNRRRTSSLINEVKLDKNAHPRGMSHFHTPWQCITTHPPHTSALYIGLSVLL